MRFSFLTPLFSIIYNYAFLVFPLSEAPDFPLPFFFEISFCPA